MQVKRRGDIQRGDGHAWTEQRDAARPFAHQAGCSSWCLTAMRCSSAQALPPLFLVLALCSLACTLLLHPHSWSSPPRWPWELACLLSTNSRCETAATVSCTTGSFTLFLDFFPFIIVIIIVLRAFSKWRFIRSCKFVKCWNVKCISALIYLQSSENIESSTGIYVKYSFWQDGSNESDRLGTNLWLL